MKTKNIVLASTLEFLGEPVTKIELDRRKDKPEAFFHFTDTENTKIATKAFWENSLRVEPRQFAVYFKELKTRVYELVKNQS